VQRRTPCVNQQRWRCAGSTCRSWQSSSSTALTCSANAHTSTASHSSSNSVSRRPEQPSRQAHDSAQPPRDTDSRDNSKATKSLVAEYNLLQLTGNGACSTGASYLLGQARLDSSRRWFADGIRLRHGCRDRNRRGACRACSTRRLAGLAGIALVRHAKCHCRAVGRDEMKPEPSRIIRATVAGVTDEANATTFGTLLCGRRLAAPQQKGPPCNQFR
jgi:hypothetical protein